MALSKNKGFDAIHHGEPKKIVIVAGPSFGSAVGFILLGAAIGAAGAIAVQRKSAPPAEVQPELFPEIEAEPPSQRVRRLVGRIGILASRTREAVGSLSESLTPVVQDAIQEARATAAVTKQGLEEELREEAETARS